MEELAKDIGDWIKTDAERLSAARNAFLDNSHSRECSETLHRAAHDLKGLGQTYGFRIVSLIADTLCKAILRAVEVGTLPEDIVNAHVDALRAVVNVVNLNLRGLSTLVEKKIS